MVICGSSLPAAPGAAGTAASAEATTVGGGGADSSASLVFAVASSDLFLLAGRGGNGPNGGVVKVPCGLPGG